MLLTVASIAARLLHPIWLKGFMMLPFCVRSGCPFTTVTVRVYSVCELYRAGDCRSNIMNTFNRSNHIQIYQAEPFGDARPHRTTLRCDGDNMGGHDIMDVPDRFGMAPAWCCREPARS